MIIKQRYDGKCHFCGSATRAGQDLYDWSRKISYHAQCEPQGLPFDPQESASLADKLGFVPFADVRQKLDWAVFERWQRWKMEA